MKCKGWLYAVSTIGICLGGAALVCSKLPRVPYKKYTKACMYLAVMDDEICRNELERNSIGNDEIVFPPKRDSLKYRYDLFLETYRGFSLKELEEEISKFEKRLEKSRKYINEEKTELQVEFQWEQE